MKRVLLALSIAAITALGLIITSPFASEDSKNDTQDSGAVQPLPGELPELQVPAPLPEDSLIEGEAPQLTSPKPALEQVVSLSRSGREPSDAEGFGVHLVQLLTDTRQPLDVDRLLDDVASDALPTATRTYLLDNVGTEFDRKFGRRWDTASDAWVRTNMTSDGIMQIEVAFVEATDIYPDHLRWPVVRIDVTLDGSTWKLRDLGARQINLPGAELEADSVLEAHLDGVGWRRISPVE